MLQQQKHRDMPRAKSQLHPLELVLGWVNLLFGSISFLFFWLRYYQDWSRYRQAMWIEVVSIFATTLWFFGFAWFIKKQEESERD